MTHTKHSDQAIESMAHESENRSRYSVVVFYEENAKMLRDLAAERAELLAERARGVVTEIPLDDDVKEILGYICYQCITTAQSLRLMGRDIPKRAESEQAAVIHWMLSHYLKNGKGWRASAIAELEAGKRAAAPTPPAPAEEGK